MVGSALCILLETELPQRSNMLERSFCLSCSIKGVRRLVLQLPSQSRIAVRRSSWRLLASVGPSRVNEGALATRQRVYRQPWVGGKHMNESSTNNQPVEWKWRAAEKVLPNGPVVVVSFTQGESLFRAPWSWSNRLSLTHP